jgi:hypothetical protein
MNAKLFNFYPRSEVLDLIKQLEERMNSEIDFRIGSFPEEDVKATAKGGFDNWSPFVMVNFDLKSKFNEEDLTHELLHIKRFLEGALILGTTDEFITERNNDQNNRISFVRDVTNQIEHTVIFCELEKYGFSPHSQADDWKIAQINKFTNVFTNKWGEVDHAWSCIKIGIGENIGKNRNIQKEYINCFAKIDPQTEKAGLKIGEILGIWIPKAHNVDLFKREYDYRRLYQRILTTANVPRNSPLFLKKLNIDNKKEDHIKIHD